MDLIVVFESKIFIQKMNIVYDLKYGSRSNKTELEKIFNLDNYIRI